jgi:hypothetical protein
MLAFDLIDQEVFVRAIHDTVQDLKDLFENKNRILFILPEPFSQYSSGSEHSVGYTLNE